MDTMVFSLLGGNALLPRGDSSTWSPGLLWSMVSADAVIAAVYFSISIALFGHLRRRPEVSTNWLARLCGAFIFACGVARVVDIWTIWQPADSLQALTKIVTAAASLATAVALWPMILRALRTPSGQQSHTDTGTLESVAGKRHDAEALGAGRDRR